MASISGGRFWGPGNTTPNPAEPGRGQMCWTYREYFVLWINVGGGLRLGSLRARELC
jgi:hypothetical protein